MLIGGEEKVTEWWWKEIAGSDEVTPLVSDLNRVAKDGTDLPKVGFVFSKEAMLVEVKVV